MIICFVGTYQNRLKPLRMVDLDVSAWREVDIDVFEFWGLLSGQFRCFTYLHLCSMLVIKVGENGGIPIAIF